MGVTLLLVKLLFSARAVRPLPPDPDHDLARDLDLDPLLQAESCKGQNIVVHSACVKSEAFSGDGLTNAVPGVTPTGPYKDPLVNELGPGRYDHKVGAGNMPRDPPTEEAGDAHSNKRYSTPHGSTLTRALIKLRKWSRGLRDSAFYRIWPRATTCQEPASLLRRLFTAVLDNLMPAKRLWAIRYRSSPTGAHFQGLPLRRGSDTARQTQVHEFGGDVHRLMPPDRVICFNVNKDSFRRRGVPDEVTDRIIGAAKQVVSVIKAQNLGISFAYRPSYASHVFDIRYNPRLGHSTLAQAFFPSDSRKFWYLGISELVVFSEFYLYYLPNILAHEFAHILGLRHWDAGTSEAELRSFQWPNTQRESRDSVMITGVHPGEIFFFPEDFRVIRELYSYGNGDVVAGRKIVDVHPKNGSHVLSRVVRYAASLVISFPQIVFKRRARA